MCVCVCVCVCIRATHLSNSVKFDCSIIFNFDDNLGVNVKYCTFKIIDTR